MPQSDAPALVSRRFDDGVSLSELVRYLREGVYLMNADGVVLDANPVALDLFGLARAGTDSHAVHDASRSPAQWRTELEVLAADGSVREFTREFLRPDGTRRTVLDTCYARHDQGVVTFHGVLADVSVEPQRPRGPAPNDMHARDPGTGAYTAAYLHALDADYAARPNALLGLCVVQLDAPAGDEDHLERMARFLLRHIRVTEAVVRTGPSQLVVLLPQTDVRGTEAVARRLQLAAQRSAPCPFHLGWAARHDGESLMATRERAVHDPVPVRVVERTFDTPRHG
jgi:hypothetical protein